MGGNLGTMCHPWVDGSNCRLQRATSAKGHRGHSTWGTHPYPARCQCWRHLTEYHRRRAVGRGSFWGAGGWKEDVEEPELGRGLQEQQQRQQHNPGAAAPHGKLGQDLPDVSKQNSLLYFFTQVQPKRHPGCRGGESCKGLAMMGRRDGEGRRTGLGAMPCPAVPRASAHQEPCPGEPAEWEYNLSRFPAP